MFWGKTADSPEAHEEPFRHIIHSTDFSYAPE
jgi:hypothetical protein